MFRWTGNPPFHIIVFVCDENVCEYWIRLVGWFWCLFWMFWRLLDVWWWELISFWRWGRFLTQIPKVIFHCILVKYVNGLREVSKHKYQNTFQVPATRSGWWRMRRSSTRNLISPPQGWVPCCALLCPPHCHHDVYTWSCSRREWCLSVHILKCPLCTVFFVHRTTNPFLMYTAVDVFGEHIHRYNADDLTLSVDCILRHT